MLKIRLMGTEKDIRWFGKFLEHNPEVDILEMSEVYHNKGTNRFYREYIEVQKNSKKTKQ